MSASVMSSDNVIVVSFNEDSDAYEAMTVLKELDSQDQIELKAAAVVARGQDGHVAIKDEVSDEHYAGAATGGILGLLIGVLGGPLGILIGGVIGVLIGSLFDSDDADDIESDLADLSTKIRVGRTSLLAEVTEPSSEVIDSAMQRLGGDVARRSVSDVKFEIAAAEDAQRAARKEARKELRKAKHEQHKEEADAKIEELKAKLHISKAPASTGS
jgi:uncharacterized membrane protein